MITRKPITKTLTLRVANELAWNTSDVIQHVKREFEFRRLHGDKYNVIQVENVERDKSYNDGKSTKYDVTITLAYVEVVFDI